MTRAHDRKDHLDDLLDAALACTFPASDPVASLSASAPGGPPGDEGEEAPDEQEVRDGAVQQPGPVDGPRGGAR